jgi:hypothetical protein
MTIDYTKASPLFKVKKLAHYVRLFGIPRTLEMFCSQYHLKAAKASTHLSEGGAEGGAPPRRPTIAIHQL